MTFQIRTNAMSLSKYLCILTFFFIAVAVQAQTGPDARWRVYPASGADEFGLIFPVHSMQSYGPYVYLNGRTTWSQQAVWYDTRTQQFSARPAELFPNEPLSPNSARAYVAGTSLVWGQNCFSMDSNSRCLSSQNLATGAEIPFVDGPSNFYGSRSTAYVGSVLRIGSDLYVGGWFTQSGPENDRQFTNSIARWDGERWHALRGGLTGSDHPRVHAMGHLDGRLYVAGAFEAAGGLAARTMAWFDLQNRTWHTLPIEPEGSISQLKILAPYVYIAGTFALRGLPTGDVLIAHVARLDTRTMTWEVIPATSTLSTFRIHALHVDQDHLVIGGEFEAISRVPAQNVARWNGTSWEALGEGTNNTINTLLVQDGFVYAGGTFTEAGGLPIRNAARFNLGAGQWEPLEVVPPKQGLYRGTVFALAPGPGSLIAGGSLPVLGTNPARHLVQAYPPGTTVSDLAGGVSLAGDSARIRSALRDGNSLFVGGRFTHAGNQQGFSNVARLDLASGLWHPLDGGVNGEVFTLLKHGDNLVVGGSFTRAGSIDAANLARYHIPTQTWHPYREGAFGAVRALTLYKGELVIAGDFSVVDWTSANRIARWDGTEWQRLGIGLNGPVHALSTLGDDLYVGGSFTLAGGHSASRVARWDGQAWQAMRVGVSGTVRALFATDREVFVGGEFTRANAIHNTDGIAANGIARFNRTSLQWEAMENGPGPVFSIAGWGSDVFVGGAFQGGIAVWEAGYATSSKSQNLPFEATLMLYPNPNWGNFLHLSNFTLPPGPVTARVYDVLGRLVMTQNAGYEATGRLSLDVVGLPSGTYALVLSSAEGSFTRTFTRLP